MSDNRPKNPAKPKTWALDAATILHLTAEGLGDASIASLIGMGLNEFRVAVRSDNELNEAYELGTSLVVDQVESKLLQIIHSPSSTSRDSTSAATVWARYNRHLTKRQIKNKAEALEELSTPELQAKLDSLIRRADHDSDHATNQDPLQLRLNQSDNPDLPQ